MKDSKKTTGNEAQSPSWKVASRSIIALFAAVMTPTIGFTFLVLFILLIIISNEMLAFGGFTTSDLSEILSGLDDLFAVSIFFGAGAFCCSTISAIGLGVPATIVGWHYGLIRWWSCIVGGFLTGCLPFAVLLALTGSLNSEDLLTNLGIILFMGFCGAMGGLVYWLVWRFLTRFGPLQENNAIP